MATTTAQVDASAPIIGKIVAAANKKFTGVAEVNAKVDGTNRQVCVWLDEGQIYSITSPDYLPPAREWVERRLGSPLTHDGDPLEYAYREEVAKPHEIEDARRDWAYGLLMSAVTWHRASVKLRKRQTTTEHKFFRSTWQRVTSDLAARASAYDDAWGQVCAALHAIGKEPRDAHYAARRLIVTLHGSSTFNQQLPLDALARATGRTRATTVIDLASQLALGYNPTFALAESTDAVLVPEALEDSTRSFARASEHPLSSNTVTTNVPEPTEPEPTLPAEQASPDAPMDESMFVFAPGATPTIEPAAPHPAPFATPEATLPQYDHPAAQHTATPQPTLPDSYGDSLPAFLSAPLDPETPAPTAAPAFTADPYLGQMDTPAPMPAPVSDLQSPQQFPWPATSEPAPAPQPPDFGHPPLYEHATAPTPPTYDPTPTWPAPGETPTFPFMTEPTLPEPTLALDTYIDPTPPPHHPQTDATYPAALAGGYGEPYVPQFEAPAPAPVDTAPVWPSYEQPNVTTDVPAPALVDAQDAPAVPALPTFEPTLDTWASALPAEVVPDASPVVEPEAAPPWQTAMPVAPTFDTQPTSYPTAGSAFGQWAAQIEALLDDDTQMSIMQRVRAASLAEVRDLTQQRTDVARDLEHAASLVAQARATLDADNDLLAQAQAILDEHQRALHAAQEAHEAKVEQSREIRQAHVDAVGEVEAEEHTLDDLLAQVARAQVRVEAARAAVQAIEQQVAFIDTDLAQTTAPAVAAAQAARDNHERAVVLPRKATVERDRDALHSAQSTHTRTEQEFNAVSERIERAERIANTLDTPDQ